LPKFCQFEAKNLQAKKVMVKNVFVLILLGAGWMDGFWGVDPARLLHAGLNSGLMCNPGREDNRRKDFG
jgi:hypothetical protein